MDGKRGIGPENGITADGQGSIVIRWWSMEGNIVGGVRLQRYRWRGEGCWRLAGEAV